MRIKAGIVGARGVLGRCLTSFHESFEWFPYLGDITHQEDLNKWASQLPKLDIVINSAAVVAVSKVDAAPDYAMQVNAHGIENLINALHAAEQLQNLWFFLPSTAHVYQSSDDLITETHVTAPVSYYGKTKLTGEMILQELAEKYAFRYCIGRIFSYTSPAQSKEFVIPGLYEKIKYAAPGETLHIRGSNNIRDFLIAEKIANIIKKIAMRRHTGIINIGSGHMLAIKDIAQEIKKQLDRRDIIFNFDNSPTTKLVANVEKLKKLSLYDSVSLQELVAHYVQGIAIKELV